MTGALSQLQLRKSYNFFYICTLFFTDFNLIRSGILSSVEAKSGEPCGYILIKTDLDRRFAQKSSQRQSAKTYQSVSI